MQRSQVQHHVARDLPPPNTARKPQQRLHLRAGRGSCSRTHLYTGCRGHWRQDLRIAALDLSQAQVPWGMALLLCGHCRLCEQSYQAYKGKSSEEVGVTPMKDRRAWEMPAQAQQSGAPKYLHAIAWPVTAAVSSHSLPHLAGCLRRAVSN